MVRYRRHRLAGGSYFFTVNLKNRQLQWLTQQIDDLQSCFQSVQKKHPFTTDAIVILPDHIHCIWTLPPDDSNYPTRWRLIKTAFTRRLKQSGIHIRKNRHGEHNLWQRRYWEHTIKDQDDFNRHADYIHFNPVKHGHVDAVSKLPYSSFHRYVSEGKLASTWGGNGININVDGFGE